MPESGVGTDFTGVLVCGAYNWGIRDYDIQRAMCEKLDLSQGGHVQITVNYVQ